MKDPRPAPGSQAAPLSAGATDPAGAAPSPRFEALPASALERIFEAIADGVFTVDSEWRVVFFNRAAERITGIARADALGRPCREVFRASICEAGCALRQTLETAEPVLHKTAYILRSDGRQVPIGISAARLFDEAGRPAGGVETFRDLSVTETLRKELAARWTFSDIVSKNEEMQGLFALLGPAAEAEASVLLEGESGTGKELFARAIHALSARRERPMVTVNCGALPDALLESELFGHVAGAFTGARRDRQGRFALADRSTLFLDEIGDISPAMQVRLLRVLEERSFEPLGSSRSVKVDVRVIAATHRDLGQLVREGKFRDDLYFRIRVLPLKIPPLRERREDIPLLAEHFIRHFDLLQGREVSQLAPETLALLMRYPFPGNVRELKNAIEHAFVLCRGGVLLPEHLPAELRQGAPGAAPASSASLSLAAAEGSAIRAALARNGGSRSATARELGIHKTTLWRKMRRLGIHGAETEAPR